MREALNMPDRTPVTFRLRTGLDYLSRGAFATLRSVPYACGTTPWYHTTPETIILRCVRLSICVPMPMPMPMRVWGAAHTVAKRILVGGTHPIGTEHAFQTQFWLVGPTLFNFGRRQGTHLFNFVRWQEGHCCVSSSGAYRP